MIKCPACGTENSEGSNFCIACGIDLTATATENRVRTDSVVEPAPDAPPMTSASVEMPAEYQYTPPPPPPSPPVYSPPPASTPPSAIPAYTPSATPNPAKDRTLALLIEIIGGMFGFLGLGWIYAGNTTTGLIWLIGFWVGNIVAIVLDIVTFGCFAVVHVVLYVAAWPISAFMLYNYAKQHPETFGP